MQLKVGVPSTSVEDEFDGSDVTVTSFRDINRIGAQVARAVRSWLRQIPMTPHVKTRMFTISAEWVEGKDSRLPIQPEAAPTRPTRKRKARK